MQARAAISRIAVIVIIVIILIAGGAGAYYAFSGKPTSSTSTTSSSTSGTNGTLTIAQGSDARSLDPLIGIAGNEIQMETPVLQPLITYSPNGTLLPLLATSWTVSSDAKTWNFSLMQNVTFQDGTKFNASAVKFTFERAINPDSKFFDRPLLQPISNITVVNNYEVEFQLSSTDPIFADVVALPYMAIVSPTAVQLDCKGNTTCATFSQKPIGTGPFSVQQWVQGDHLTLVRYSGYWGKAPPSQSIVFKIIPNAADREAALKSGQVDIINDPPVTDLSSLNSSGFVALTRPTPFLMYIALNNLYGPLQKQLVRQALNYAVDKQTIAKTILNGLGTVAAGPVDPAFFGAQDIGAYSYNVTKAKELLSQAGYPNGFTMTLWCTNGRYLEDAQICQSVSGYLAAVGVTANVQLMDTATYYNSILAPANTTKFESGYIGTTEFIPDAGPFLQELYYSQNAPPNGIDITFYNNTMVDRDLNLSSTSGNQTYRATLLQNAEQQIWSDAPAIFMFYVGYAAAMNSNVHGVQYSQLDDFVYSAYGYVGS